jgi:sugar phosphate isomerase/epimerase
LWVTPRTSLYRVINLAREKIIMQISICSFSFHRLLAAGKQDIFRYIQDCKVLGCTQLDPWNGHLAPLASGDDVLHTGKNPQDSLLRIPDDISVSRVKAAGDEAGLPFGCIAVDGAHIYHESKEERDASRQRAYRWLDICASLRAGQMRVDAGGVHEMPQEMFAIIVEGYQDLVERAKANGIQMVIENHWGSSQVPENIVRILEAVPGLGLLFDSHNWAPGRQKDGWKLCAKYASITHLKTFAVTPQLVEPSVDVPEVLNLLLDSGYQGCWGVESVPKDGDEYQGARRTIGLIENVVSRHQGGQNA